MTEDNTQPANSFDSQSQQNPEFESWGKLSYPLHKTNKPSIWLKQNVFKVGKLDDCDVKISELKQFLPPMVLNGVSKVQFVIERRLIHDVCVIFITDHSSNGTFINDQLIGKNKIRILDHMDFIGIVKSDFNFFQFQFVDISTRENERIPYFVRVDYYVVNKIGKGRFGDVFYVLNKKTCQPSAMKMRQVQSNIHENDDDYVEVKILEAIKHEHIVSFHGKIMKDDNLFLFLEYMDRGDLRQFLKENGRLNETLARSIFHQIISGIAYLHQNLIVHKNIEPRNILLSNSEGCLLAKITNFKSSKKLKKGVSTVKIKPVINSNDYVAPELRRYLHPYDTRVDVWSFGVLLYECLCGELRFKDGVENRFFSKLLIPPKVSVAVSRILEGSLKERYYDRFFAQSILCDSWFKRPLNQNNKRSNTIPFEIPLKRLKMELK